MHFNFAVMESRKGMANPVQPHFSKWTIIITSDSQFHIRNSLREQQFDFEWMGWGMMVLLKKRLSPVRIKWLVPKQFIRIRIYLQFCLHVTNAIAKTHYPKNCWAVTCRSTACPKKCMYSGNFLTSQSRKGHSVK